MGRGLSALISTAPSPQDNEELREIEIDLIKPGEQQPRTSFDELIDLMVDADLERLQTMGPLARFES